MGREAMHVIQNLLVSGSVPLMKCDELSTLKRLLSHGTEIHASPKG